MCIKRVGVEIALMEGARPIHIAMHLLVDGNVLHKLPLMQDAFPLPRRLNEEERCFMQRDQRRRGEHRPPRIAYGLCRRAPYTFYSARVPGNGLPLAGTLGLVLWMHLYDEGWPHEPLFHFKCSDPNVHPLTGRTHWVERKQWTPASNSGWPVIQRDVTACGCGVRLRVRFE